MRSSLFQILFCDLLYLITFLLLFRVMHGQIVRKRSIRWAFIAMMLMCFFPYITNDYYHYKVWFETLGVLDRTHIEEVYQSIAMFSPSYLFFRIIVWGSALILSSITFKLTKIDYEVALFLFIIRYFIGFSYARVSLCIAMMFCGLALITQLWEKKYFLTIMGVFLIYLSFYFHKTATFGIGICIMSLFFVKQRRFNIVLLIISIPILVYALTSLVDIFMDIDFSENDLMVEKGQRYIELGNERFHSFTKNIINIIWRVPYYLVLIMYLKIVAKDNFNTMPITIRVFANAAAISIFVSFLFLVVPSIANFTLYYRFLNYAMISSIVFVTYCYSNRLCPILVKLFYYLSLIGVTLSLLFRIATHI